jgi:rhamnose utilization protein RhaD (predicted bifunctional aldolase and dehydrogenase)
MEHDGEFRALLACAASIGRDPSLIQVAGGNVSLKHDGVLWAKASGTWLAWAGQKPIMVPVRIAPLLEALHQADAEEDVASFTFGDLNSAGLHPSIETSLHAALPFPVVIHVHCVETIARAVCSDAETAVAPLLQGLRWCYVPYIRPGPPLTRSLSALRQQQMCSCSAIVAGPTVAATEALLARVTKRLRGTVREPPPPEMPRLATLAAGTAYLGTDQASLAVARRGSLYPDHVIFLGPGIMEGAPSLDGPPMLVVPGAGVPMHRDASPGAHAAASCLADVTARLDPSEPLNVLSGAQESELLGWEAETYRRTVAAS